MKRFHPRWKIFCRDQPAADSHGAISCASPCSVRTAIAELRDEAARLMTCSPRRIVHRRVDQRDDEHFLLRLELTARIICAASAESVCVLPEPGTAEMPSVPPVYFSISRCEGRGVKIISLYLSVMTRLNYL